MGEGREGRDRSTPTSPGPRQTKEGRGGEGGDRLTVGPAPALYFFLLSLSLSSARQRAAP